jgi:hypothetical protein
MGMRCIIALCLCVASGTRSASAQSARINIVLPSRDSLAMAGPAVQTAGVATASHIAELIRNGFPARLHYKLERWAAGTFVNDVKATEEWEVIVQYDALADRYRVVRATEDGAVVLGAFANIKDADARIAEPYRVHIKLPKRGEKTYYALTLQVEAMSLSDLDEVRRWLNGELRPAVRGRKNPGTAITTGVRTLLVRLLGGERLQYKVNTGVFRP